MSIVISKPWRFFISISCFLLFASGCSNTGSTITPIAENGLTQSAQTLAPQSVGTPIWRFHQSQYPAAAHGEFFTNPHRN